MRVELRRDFLLADTGLGTKNLHSLVYCGSTLVSECDLGNIEDILMQNKKLKTNWNEINKFIEDNLKSLEENATNKKTDNAVAIYGREMNGFYKVRRKMRELEQGKDE